jgi:dihydromethanopterin reductase
MGSVCIVGYNTAKELPYLPKRYVAADIRHWTPEKMIEYLSGIYPNKKIFIIGGMKTYERYAHLINRWHISRVEYNGEADTYFNWEIMQ